MAPYFLFDRFAVAVETFVRFFFVVACPIYQEGNEEKNEKYAHLFTRVRNFHAFLSFLYISVTKKWQFFWAYFAYFLISLIVIRWYLLSRNFSKRNDDHTL